MVQKKVVGRYIVSEPEICHGKLTFKGIRIFVEDVLNMVAEGIYGIILKNNGMVR